MLDADEGVAVIQYQGRPYLVAIRHIRPHVETYSLDTGNLKMSQQAEDELFDIMKTIEHVPPMSKRMLGYIPEQKPTGVVWRQVPSQEHFDEKLYQKAKIISADLTTRSLSGIIYGCQVKFVRPPNNTTGYLITWTSGSMKYNIMEHWSSTRIKAKKIMSQKEDLCILYLYYHVLNQEEETNSEWKSTITNDLDMEAEDEAHQDEDMSSVRMQEDPEEVKLYNT